jgi:hypothetical protein
MIRANQSNVLVSSIHCDLLGVDYSKLLANFKSSRGNYRECRYYHTSPIDHFAPDEL